MGERCRCDATSRTELVVPLLVDGELVGVFDIVSPSLDRFSTEDQIGIEALCETFCETFREIPAKWKTFI